MTEYMYSEGRRVKNTADKKKLINALQPIMSKKYISHMESNPFLLNREINNYLVGLNNLRKQHSPFLILFPGLTKK
jgi:hypothetical protein